jgi:hypothetical protein
MKMINTRAFSFSLKPYGLAAALVLGFQALPAMAADDMEASPTPPASTETSQMTPAGDTFSNDWQAPVIVEFNKLDTSGNGLLLPKEASKGKAFNKKSFAKADSDHDGTIDQNEYIFFKTGKMPEAAKPASMAPEAKPPMPAEAKPAAQDMKSEMPMPDKAMPDKAMPDIPMPKQKDLPMAE